MNEANLNEANFAHVVGVFRDRTNAEQAIEKLKGIGIGEDQIQLTEYNPQKNAATDSLSGQESNKRILVNVDANGKHQEAVGIMVSYGANNADIPPGTKLVQGSLLGTNSAPVDLQPGQQADQNTPESSFGKNANDPFMH